MATKRRKVVKYGVNPKKEVAVTAVQVISHQDYLYNLGIERKVGRMVVAGLTYDQIAAKLHLTTNEVFDIAKKVVSKWRNEMALVGEDAREVELKRLDALWATVYPLTMRQKVVNNETGAIEHTEPDLEAVKICLSIQERRAKLLGIDAADKLKKQVVDTMTRRYIGVDPDAL